MSIILPHTDMCDLANLTLLVYEYGKKFEVDNSYPESGSYALGDIVWNDKPKPTGYVGWICVRAGTPGEWKPFGQISA